MAQRKCVICGEPISKEELEEAVPYKGRMAHVKCFNLTMKVLANDKKEKLEEKKAQKATSKTRQQKTQEVVNSPVSEAEYRAKNELYDYMRQLLGVESLNPKIYVLTQKYIKEYDTSYQEIKDAFYFWFELKNNEPQGDCIGLLPYILEESRIYWKLVKEIEEKNRDVDIKKYYSEKVVTINPRHKKIKQIDIENIGITEGVQNE